MKILSNKEFKELKDSIDDMKAQLKKKDKELMSAADEIYTLFHDKERLESEVNKLESFNHVKAVKKFKEEAHNAVVNSYNMKEEVNCMRYRLKDSEDSNQKLCDKILEQKEKLTKACLK